MQNSGAQKAAASPIRKLRYEWLFDGDRWHEDAVLEVGHDGVITALRGSETDDGALPRTDGLCLPGMPNLHSHAFQRAIAGLTERRGPGGNDSFWSWRDLMYRAAASLRADDLAALTSHLFMEMLEAGYTGVAEFHYLHRPGTGPDALEPRESADVVTTAARDAGIALTLLPVLYQRSGFDADGPTDAQRRFVLATDEFLALREGLEADAGSRLRVGAAIHSLRAVAPDALREVMEALPEHCPRHIHIAEQQAEVDECLRSTGRRPVAWLLEEFDVDERWCLVHATHIGSAERLALADSGAVAGLCPVTEANLGDGLFPLPEFLSEGGCFGVGSDSQAAVDAVCELRWLEYGQRLRRQGRSIVTTPEMPDNGPLLWSLAATGGARALGRGTGRLAPGQPADLVVFEAPLPSPDPALSLDAVLFGPGTPRVAEVRVDGVVRVRNGRHVARTDEADRAAAIAASLVR